MDELRFKEIKSRVYSGRLQPPHVMLDDLESLVEMVSQLRGEVHEHDAQKQIDRIKETLSKLEFEDA